MKKNKIKLADIKVESFITKLNGNEQSTLEGAANNSGWWVCSLYLSGCMPSTSNANSYMMREDCNQPEIRSHFAPKDCGVKVQNVLAGAGD